MTNIDTHKQTNTQGENIITSLSRVINIHDLIDDVTRSQNRSNFEIDISQYLSYSVDQKLKMSEMLMAIFLVYSTSGITFGKKVCRAQNGGHFENFEILTQLQFDLRYEKIVANYAKKVFLW